MQKLVSVIIPTYSRPKFIIRTIESVLKQTYFPIEIIVVDDNGIGTENQKHTEKILAPYIQQKRISYIPHEVNKNGSAARNTGIKASHGEYVTLMDDDDEMMSDKIKKQVAAIEKSNGKYHASYCGVEKRFGPRVMSRKIPSREGNLQKELLLGTWGIGSGSNPLFCREVFDNVGFFDESFWRKQDVEMMVRFFRKYQIAKVEEVLLVKNSDSVPRRPDPLAYQKIIEKFLDTFAYDIEKYPKPIQDKIRFGLWFTNAQLAMNASCYKVGFDCVKRASSYKRLSIKNWLQLMKQALLKRQMR